MKKIAILGSTGSIGTQTLEVVRENRDIEVTALAAGSNIGLLEAQIRKFHPVLAAVWDEAKSQRTQRECQRSGCEGSIRNGRTHRSGSTAGCRNPGDSDRRMIGILPTIEGIKAGRISHWRIKRHW